MFDTEYQAPKRATVPTVKQYLKSLPKKSKALQQLFQVEMIWLPGKFDNVTLQTHAFRLILNDNHLLYTELQERFSRDEDYTHFPAFGIRITERETCAFRLETMEKSKGEWKPLGESGVKFDSLEF